MNKITPQASRTIKELAATLPKLQKKHNGQLMFRTRTERVLGKDLPKSYKRDNDWYPMRYYTAKFEEPILVNHEVNLYDAFKKDGYEGLTHYTNHVTNFLASLPAKEKPKSMFQKIKDILNGKF